MRNNILKLYLIRFGYGFRLYMPVFILFYQDNGLNLQEIMIIQGLYSLTIALSEIPSGYFSDTWGRKQSLIVGTCFGFLGLLGYSLSYDFWAFLVSAICVGLGSSFMSGTDSAMLYDSLQALGRKDDFLKMEGRTYSMGNVAEAVAAIIGGWLAATYSLRMPMMIQVGVAAFLVLVAFSLVEPPFKKSGNKNNWQNIKDILRYAFREHPMLRWYIVLSASMGTATVLIAWFAQPFFKSVGLTEYWIGILWAILNLLVGIVAFFAHHSYRWASKKQLATIIVIGISGCFVLLGMNPVFWGLSFIFAIYLLRGLAVPVLKDLVNQNTPSEMRATVLSMRSFVIRVFFAVLAPLMGWIADVYTLGDALIVSGVVLGVIGGVCVLVMKE